MNLRKVRICAHSHLRSHPHLHIKWAYHGKVIYSHVYAFFALLSLFLEKFGSGSEVEKIKSTSLDM